MSTDTDVFGWLTANDSNSTVNGLNIAENCPPANINNAIRAVMGALARAASGIAQFAADTGAVNAYAVAPAAVLLSYFTGYRVTFTPANTNTGASTLSVNGLAALPIYNLAHTALTGGEIVAQSFCEVIYSATLNSGAGAWVLVNTDLGIGTLLKASISNLGVPPGTLIHFAGSSAPTGFLVANAAAVSRSTYATLFGVIGTTYGAGDGYTTFNLPDGRGVFLRGLDSGRGLDTGRTLGSYQADKFGSHTHGTTETPHVHAISGQWVGANGVGGANITGGNPPPSPNANTTNPASTGLTVNAAGSNETAPKNMASLICIKT
jgi:microcystin-dependent protein